MLVLTLLVAVIGGVAPSTTCTAVDIDFGLCSISPSVADSVVVLDGAIPGSGGAWDDALAESVGGGVEGGGDPDHACLTSFIDPASCGTAPAPPTVSIADVATFAPSLAAAMSEPGGWAIVGLPVNLVGPSGPVTVEGTLLGGPAQVRFTPTVWHWDLGDGATASVSTPGASWTDLGLTEFSGTATSHVYSAPGIHRVSLAVDVIAEYRIGGGAWSPVPGMLTVPVSGFDLVVATADTVLVDRDCLAAPAGPGC